MSDLIVVSTTPSISLAASTAKTLLEITAPANQRLKVLRWGLFFNEETGDASPATPLLCELVKVTVTGTGSATTLALVQPASETIQATGKHNFTVEGTITDIYDNAFVNAQTGYEVIFPMGQEVIVEGGDLIAIRATPGAVTSDNGLSVIAKMWFEE